MNISSAITPTPAGDDSEATLPDAFRDPQLFGDEGEATDLDEVPDWRKLSGAQFNARFRSVLGAEYELLSLIGQGGFARVYRARDLRLDRMVAIKVIRPDVVGTEAFLESFRTEGVALAKLRHPGIVPIYDIRERAWAWDWIDRLGLPRSLFLEPSEPGTVIGELSADAASRLGLRAGTPVAVGGAATQCGLLGVGALEPGDAVVVAGTTAPVEIVLSEPLPDPDIRCWQGRHLVADRSVIESSAGAWRSPAS